MQTVQPRDNANHSSTFARYFRKVMKHWRPDMDAAVPLDGKPQRRRKRDWTSLEAYAPPRARPQHYQEARVGGAIGLALMAGFCLLAAVSAATLLVLPDPIDEMAVEP